MKLTIIILLTSLLFISVGCTTTSNGLNKEEIVVKNNIKYTLKIKPKKELTEKERELVLTEFDEIVQLYRDN